MKAHRFTPILSAIIVTILGGTLLTPSVAAAKRENLTIVTYNVFAQSTKNQVLSDVATIIKEKDPEVLTLQEVYQKDRRSAIRAKFACKTCTYRAYSVGNHGAKENMLLWKRDVFAVKKTGISKSVDGYTEHGVKLPPLYLNWARLKYKGSKQQIIVGSTHLPSLVDRNDDGYPDAGKHPKRVDAYEKHMNMMASKVKSWKKQYKTTPIFITGDFNVNFRKDEKVQHKVFPYDSFSKVKGASNWQDTDFPEKHPHVETHTHEQPGMPKARLIDYIFLFKDGDDVHISGTQVLGKGLHSDHKAVVGHYKIKL